MKNVMPEISLASIKKSSETEWILNALLSEFKIFSKKPIEDSVIPYQSKTVYILYEGQHIRLCDIVHGTLERMHLLYKRSVRTVNHAWIQYWFLNRIQHEALSELIDSHQKAFDNLSYLIELVINEMDVPPFIDELQDEALNHQRALQMLREKLSEYLLQEA